MQTESLPQPSTPSALSYETNKRSPIVRAFLHHLVLSLRLNLRNPQAMVFGYVVPVFFLIAFGSVFGHGNKIPLTGVLGQLLTISALGGACFGLPIQFVTERERGVWRRYRLTPLPTVWFVISMLFGRYLLVLSAAILQLILAFWFYKQPMPQHPWLLFVAFSFASFAFLGLGLVISMVANSTSAVQALGQSLFLPMIMIGGVGVPLRMLPVFVAKHVAIFLPGRYAVQAMDLAIADPSKFHQPRQVLIAFNFIALAVIGIAACLAGAKLFRWENDTKFQKSAFAWVLVAVMAWAAAGIAAEWLRVW